MPVFTDVLFVYAVSCLFLITPRELMQCELVEAGFEYVCDRNDTQVFRDGNNPLQKNLLEVWVFLQTDRTGSEPSPRWRCTRSFLFLL